MVPLESLLPLAAFMTVASITPGPNNVLVASAGAHSGYRATVPHLLGIGVGHSFQVALCALGVGAAMVAMPGLMQGLRLAAAGFLAWLAWRMLRAAPPVGDAAGGGLGPMSFLGAAAFQWVNPKAWAMALTTSSALLPDVPDRVVAVGSACLVVVLVNFPCVSVWAACGASLRRALGKPRRGRAFNAAMGLSLLAMAGWIVIG